MTSVDLTAASSSTLTQALQTAMTSGGITTAIKTPAQAQEHFLAQAPALLASNIWVVVENGVPMIALHVKANGNYLMGEGGVAKDAGTPGTEYRTLSASGVDAKGFVIQSSGDVDTNGEWGLSHLQGDERLLVRGDTLIVNDANPGATAPFATFTKMENDPEGLVGAWALADTNGAPMEGRMFFSKGKMMMVDGIGDVPETGPGCGGPGVEIGIYTFDAATKTLTGAANPVNNTNGCAGLWEAGSDAALPIQFTLGANGLTAQIAGNDGEPWTENLVRLSK